MTISEIKPRQTRNPEKIIITQEKLKLGVLGGLHKMTANVGVMVYVVWLVKHYPFEITLFLFEQKLKNCL